MRDICRKEYGFEASAVKTGKTVYADVAPQNLVGGDLGLNQKTVERLYDTLLTVTRVVMSSDADVEFMVIRASDVGTGSVITILRRISDIKHYFYMKISRADFESRGVMEIDRPSEKDAAPDVHDVTPTEFIARLAATKLQQKITYNPLVSVFVQVHRVTGSFHNGVLTIRMSKTAAPMDDAEGGDPAAVDLFLRQSVVKVAADVLHRYDEAGAVTRVRVVEDRGRVVYDFSREALMKERKALPKSKSWVPDEDY